MLIRDADAARDAPACARIYAPFVRDSAVSFEDAPPTPSQLRERMQSLSLTHPWLVAEDRDQVIGFAYGSPHRQRAAYRWATEVSVYVEPAHHHRGAGSELYKALLGLLAGQGLRVACAGITLPNKASVALHRSLGFERIGTYRAIGWKAGAWRDVEWWQLELGAATEGIPAEPAPPGRLHHG